MILTFSTTGYVAIIILIVSLLFFGKFSNLHTKRILIPTILIFALVLTIGSQTIFANVFGKIFEYSDSTVARVASLVNGMEISFDNPFFGVFPNNLAENMRLYALASSFNFGSNNLNTNTVSAHFASFGVLFGFIFLIGTYKYMKKLGRTYFYGIVLFIIMMLLYAGQSFYSFFPYLFVFYGFKREKNLAYVDSSIKFKKETL